MVGSARTYIRPLQRDLDMDAVLGLPEGVNLLLECLRLWDTSVGVDASL